MPQRTHIDLEHVEHDGEGEAAHAMASYVSAPVSREHGYSMSGEPPEPSASRVTLTRAQREHAEAAGVSVEEYAKQLLKMGKMRKAGLLKD